jgi:hypothetical protein
VDNGLTSSRATGLRFGFFEQLGFILVSKDFLRNVFSQLKEKRDIEEIGRKLGHTIAKEYVS